ncbi:hypothetical protein [Micromonospora sp. ATCC 39149]|nr:hypothetical protein [Micromonospora sp. ATCC 39149]
MAPDSLALLLLAVAAAVVATVALAVAWDRTAISRPIRSGPAAPASA